MCEASLHQVNIYYCDRRKLPAGKPLDQKKTARQLLLSEVLGVNSEDQLLYLSHGKPVLKDKGPHFSLSHGRDFSILAVSDSNLGADIQEIPFCSDDSEKESRRQHSRLLVCRKTFPDAYRKEYYSASLSDEKVIFTRLWTCTEAILKAQGTGLTLSLSEHPELLIKWKVQSVLFSGHYISIAMEEPFFCSDPIPVCRD